MCVHSFVNGTYMEAALSSLTEVVCFLLDIDVLESFSVAKA